LNALADTWSIDLLTLKINGGTTDAAERSRLCEAALQAIGA
jgi:predicted chitinase